MKKAVAAVLALLLPLVSSAQGVYQVLRLPLVEEQSYTTNTYQACVTLGEADNPLGRWREGRDRVKTSGSSTTLTTVGSNGSLSDISVGDVLRFKGDKPQSWTIPHRVATAVASVNSITLDVAADLDNTAVDANKVGYDPLGYNFEYRKQSCTTSTSAKGTAGAFLSLKDFTSGAFTVVVESENGGSNDGNLDYQLQCYIESSVDANIVVTSGNVAFASIPTAVVLGNFDFATYGWTHCRVAVKVNAVDNVVYSVFADLKEGVR